MIISLKDMVKLADTVLRLVEMYEEAVPDNPDSTTAKHPDWLAEGVLLAHGIKCMEEGSITGSSYQDENGNPRLPNMPPVEEVFRKLKKEVAADKELIKKLEHKIMILGGSSIPGL